MSQAQTETPEPLPAADAGADAVVVDVDVMEDTLWKKQGWIARVIKNEDDEGWAVEMTRQGDQEPALVGPWTMGRDKKNPKPLNPKDFQTLVKTAAEFLERAQRSAWAALHKTATVFVEGDRFKVALDIATDEDDPHALLTVTDEGTGEVKSTKRVAPNFKFTTKAAEDAVTAALADA